jgi:putative transcriptional regulator
VHQLLLSLGHGHDVQADIALKNRIHVLRAEKNWSQAELAVAVRVRVSRNSINAIENGRFDPSLPLAFRIADAFGLSVEEVFDKTDL